MRYLTLLDSFGSYVDLGITLVLRSGNYFLIGLDSNSVTSLVNNWCGIYIRYEELKPSGISLDGENFWIQMIKLFITTYVQFTHLLIS